jgi:O-antigen/teichoic acid export membrane protein
LINKAKEHKNFLIHGFGQIINLMTPIFIAPYIIATCGIENFGKLGVATSFYLILALFIDFGSSLTGVKEISVNKNNLKHIKKYLDVVYTLKILIFIMLFIVLILAILFFNQNIDSKLYLFSIIFLLGQVINPLWIYQGTEDFKTSNVIIFISKSLYIALVFIFIKKAEHYVYVIFLLGLTNTITFLFYFIKVYFNNKLALFAVSYKDLKNEFLTTVSILLSNIFISIYTNAPIIIVKYILGDYAAGIYKIGDMFLMVLRNYLSVFFNVSFPKFCVTYAENFGKGINYLKKINTLNIMLLLFSSIALYVFSIIYISSFSLDTNQINTISFCNKFLFIPLLIALNIPFYQILIFENQQKAISKVIISSTIIMLLICYVLTLKFKITGTLISIYISEALTTSLLIILYFHRKKLNKK